MAIPNNPTATRVVALAAGVWTLIDTGLAGRIQLEVQNQGDATVLLALGSAQPGAATGWALEPAAEWVRIYGPGVRVWARAAAAGSVAVNEIGA